MAIKKKSPLKSSPLRNPAQSLDEKIDSLINDHGVQYAVIIIFPAVLTALEWYRWYFNMPYSPFIYTGIAIVCSSFGIYKLFSLRKQVKHYRLGRDGEKAVGQHLELLREHGCKVFHDIVCEGFNIDHVIISKGGIFTVETKTYSKPSSGKPVIKYQDGKLQIDNNKPSTDIIVQATSEANWLKGKLKELTGHDCFVKPVVTFPGWYIEGSASNSEVWVLNPKALSMYVQNSSAKLSQVEVNLYAFSLSQYIRVNEKVNV